MLSYVMYVKPVLYFTLFLLFYMQVLFLHKYSGSVGLESAIVVTLSYTLSTVTMLYAQYLSGDFPNPSVDLKYVGVGLFLTGIIGNFYHHYLLAKLRKEGDKEYKIPQGGLFDLVICPHYLFEILGYVGISCISQTVYTFVFTLGTMFYLMGRSHATREWYLTKFGDKFPKEVKAFIPYVF
ncbi:putative 3-oxo-5-alpha-steroid 4-dehydrogenase (NADP(+)) [Helianthus anomalus]